ncbi:MAG: SIS domain-containing protein [Candidatus Omnitrophota bacterium]|nr:SIS domain-containing protein [Candidatus Omnitrophota bacterium]MBU2529129.1 SIS domain-containing protein [bacterium]MBU3929476.1 SIS domain-containing protein [bacterium]MBU4122827.1 SIS domain-containing protein [bacterium]
MIMLSDNIAELTQLLGRLNECSPDIAKAVKIIKSVLKKKGRILIFGNGGSAADANHFAAELVGRFEKDRKALPAISLNTDTSILTAVGNDLGYKNIFSRQIQALGSVRDAVIAITTSGKSNNIIEACRSARKKKIKIIALTGKTGLRAGGPADVTIAVPSRKTARIQEAHALILHTICGLLENDM